MAISPEDTNLLTDLEEEILKWNQVQIDDHLRKTWEKGVRCAWPLKPEYRDELITALIQKYRDAGWLVEYEKEGHKLVLTA